MEKKKRESSIPFKKKDFEIIVTVNIVKSTDTGLLIQSRYDSIRIYTHTVYTIFKLRWRHNPWFELLTVD